MEQQNKILHLIGHSHIDPIWLSAASRGALGNQGDVPLGAGPHEGVSELHFHGGLRQLLSLD